MESTKRIRLAMLGAVLLTGCQLKIDPSILPTPRPLPTGTEPGRTPMPTATPTTCDRPNPAAPASTGNAKHGAYSGQKLPNGWDNLASEQAVTDGIAKLENGSDWACFQQFYGGAFAVYKTKRGVKPSATPTPTTSTSPTPKPAVTATPSIGLWMPPPPCYAADSSQVSLSGTVFDEQGVPFPDGVEVRVSTKGFAFNTTVNVQDGRYWVYGAPAGEKLEITAVHQASGEARRRFVTPAAQYNDCGPQGFGVVNFGGPKSADDALGHRYPLPTVESSYKLQDAAAVSGAIYDINGNAVEARITLTSLLADRPYTATVSSSNGQYVVSNVLTGVPMEIRVEAEGYTARARADVFFAGEGGRKGNVVNFGGDPTIEDPYAPQYALAPRLPENLVRPVAVKGQVATIEDKTVTLGVVRAQSLDPNVPFSAKADIGSDGFYSFANVPAGVEIEFTLEAQGYEPIFRYERLWFDRGVYINFGGGSESDDPEGESYALVETISWDD